MVGAASCSAHQETVMLMLYCFLSYLFGFLIHWSYLKFKEYKRLQYLEQMIPTIAYHWAQAEMDYLYEDCTVDEFRRWNPDVDFSYKNQN